MNKGLDLIERQQTEIIDGYPTGNIFIGVTQEELTELEKELKAIAIIKEHIISPKYDLSGIYVEKNGDFYEIKLRNGANCLFTEDEYNSLKEAFSNNDK